MATIQNALSILVHENQSGSKQRQMSLEDEFDYSQMGQWLRAAVLGANDGLVTVASLMMGVGAMKQDAKDMILPGFACLVAGACSMAIGEFVSVYSQLDIEVAQMKRENRMTDNHEEKRIEHLPNPMQAALASALAFSLGAIVPLLTASFIGNYKVRMGVVVVAVSLALVIFEWTGSVPGGTPVVKSCVRGLLGGLMAVAITFGVTKLIGTSGL